MDPKLWELAQKIATFLMPLLPHLLKVGDKAAEEVGKQIGGEGWDQAKALWDKLRRKKNVEQVAQTAAALPDNQALREALHEEIARALQEDGALREEVARLWGEAEAAGVTVIGRGDRSVAVGGDVSGSVIVTGDQSWTVEERCHGIGNSCLRRRRSRLRLSAPGKRPGRTGARRPAPGPGAPRLPNGVGGGL
jgi:hypothetical protein